MSVPSGLIGELGIHRVGVNVESENTDTTANAAPAYVAEHWNDTTTLLRPQSDEGLEYTGPGSPSADAVSDIPGVADVRNEDIPADYPDSETQNSVDNLFILLRRSSKPIRTCPEKKYSRDFAGLATTIMQIFNACMAQNRVSILNLRVI